MEKFVQINIRVYGVCKALMSHGTKKTGGIKMKCKNDMDRRDKKREIGVKEGRESC